jgi:hypothetical protein
LRRLGVIVWGMRGEIRYGSEFKIVTIIRHCLLSLGLKMRFAHAAQ